LTSKVFEKSRSQGPKEEDFHKKKIPPGIYPIYNCAKFQHDCAIFDFSERFGEILVPRALKERFFKK